MANTKVTGSVIADGAITAAKIASGALDSIIGGYLTTNTYATESYVTTVVNNLIDAAPASLDTLNELAAALNDDANFATTVTNSLATKLNLSGGTLTGDLIVNTNVGIGTSSPATKLNIRTDASDDGILLEKTDGTDIARLFYDGSSTNGRLDMFSGGIAKVQIHTNGTSHFSGGNVGIGASSPSYKLEVRDTADAVIALVKTGANSLRFLSTSSGGVINQVDNNNLAFKTNDTERMRIDSSGNIKLQFSANRRIGIDLNDGEYFYGMSSNSNARGLRLISAAADSNAGIIFETGNTYSTVAERMRIDSSGNVGIGTSSIGANSALVINKSNGYLSVLSNVGTGGSTNPSTNYGINFGFNRSNGDGESNIVWGSLPGLSGYLSFANWDGSTYSERMRITSVGTVTIGTGVSFNPESNNRNTLFCSSNTTGGTTLIAFFNPNGNIGAITTSGNSTAYLTSSDYRLKENVVEMTGALDRVDALKPSRFNFIADPEKTVDGFLAHEVGEVIPEAIFGEKDAVDEEGNPVYQGIDQSKLVPLLTAAIQELRAEIETLKSQINA